jgi:hypothetical protein
MKDKILLTLGVASFLYVFGVRSVIGCVGQDKYNPDLYKYNQNNHSIKQTVNPLSHQLLAFPIPSELIDRIVHPNTPPDNSQSNLGTSSDKETHHQCREDFRQCIDDSKEDKEQRNQCREDLRQCLEEDKQSN